LRQGGASPPPFVTFLAAPSQGGDGAAKAVFDPIASRITAAVSNRILSESLPLTAILEQCATDVEQCSRFLENMVGLGYVFG